MFFPLFSSFSLSLFLRSPRVLENITIHPFFIVSLLFIGLFPPAWKAEDEDNRGASFFFYFFPFLSNFLFPFVSFSHFLLLISLLLSPRDFISLVFCSSVIFLCCISSYLFFFISLLLSSMGSSTFTVNLCLFLLIKGCC